MRLSSTIATREVERRGGRFSAEASARRGAASRACRRCCVDGRTCRRNTAHRSGSMRARATHASPMTLRRVRTPCARTKKPSALKEPSGARLVLRSRRRSELRRGAERRLCAQRPSC
jgi:hypothetical protein